MITIRPERPEDAAAIEDLLDRSFGPGRYAKTAYRLREGVGPIEELSFVACDDGVLRGSIRYWPVWVGGRSLALLLGPLAIDPSCRNQGYGVRLMTESLAKAEGLGYRLVILVGDAPYYARVGFAQVPPGQITMPGPVDLNRLLCRELVPGALEQAHGMLQPGKGVHAGQMG